MFTVEERAEVRRSLLARAEADPTISAAAVTGSEAVGATDRWSDIDLAFGVDGELHAALAHWTGALYRDYGALHHWDLPSGPTVYRVFLLPGCLEVDLGFTPADRFGPRGRAWRLAFGAEAGEPPSAAPSREGELIGLCWHHVLHARICIERGKPWQAEWLVSGIRDHVLALACLRLGYPTSFAKGADLLPPEVTEPLHAALVSSLAPAELRRALAAAAGAVLAELRRTDPVLADRLEPTIEELALPAS